VCVCVCVCVGVRACVFFYVLFWICFRPGLCVHAIMHQFSHTKSPLLHVHQGATYARRLSTCIELCATPPLPGPAGLTNVSPDVCSDQDIWKCMINRYVRIKQRCVWECVRGHFYLQLTRARTPWSRPPRASRHARDNWWPFPYALSTLSTAPMSESAYMWCM